MENKKKLKKNVFTNILLLISLICVIVNFIVIILFKNDDNLIINLISSLLLSIFTIFFIFSSLSNNKKKKRYLVCSCLFLIFYSSFNISNNLGLLNILKTGYVDDFTNKSLVDVIKWSEKNKVEINQVYEYSDMIDEYHIIGQNKSSSTPLKNLKDITIVVSEGPNPEKDVVVPNMVDWDCDRVLNYIKKNHLSNVEVDFVSSDKNRDTVIEQSKSGNMKRNDEMKLTFSYGEEENLEEIKLKDLNGMSQFEAEFYLKQHGIKFDTETKFSSKIKRDYIIKTNKKVGDKLKPNSDDDKIKLIISKGPKIKVPNLKKYSMLEITQWVISNKLKLEFNDRYDDTIKANKVIDVNYKEGDEIEEKTLISVSVSKGKLIMQDFGSLDEFRAWALKYSVNYEEKYEFSDDVSEGDVIEYSHKTGDTIKNNDTVVVTISNGSKVKVPNVVGDTKTSVIKKLDDANLKYNFVYEASSKAKDICLKQSLSSGSEVAKGSTITITLSNGKKTSTKSNNSSSSSSANNNTSSNNSSNTPSCDKSKGDYLNIQAGGNGSETKTIITQMNPNHKFSWNMVSACPNGDSSPGNVCSQLEGVWKNYCDSISITIVK